MAYKTFSDGVALPASDLNTYLMRQSVTKTTAAHSGLPTPAEGDVVYETDTDSLFVYTTATTGWRAPWNLPWGYVGSTKVTSAVSTNAGDLATVTFNAVGNRRYRVTGQVYEFTSTVANDIGYMTLADNSGTNFAQQTNTVDTASSGSPGDTIVGLITESTGGSRTYYLKGGRAGGTGNLTFGAAATAPILILVEDIGPAGAPL